MLGIYITCKNRKEAEKIADVLLSKRLIACANVFPLTSLYWWKGRKRRSKEYIIAGKTREGKFNAIVKQVKKVHSYKVPFISAWKEQTTKDINKWLRKEVK